MADTKLNLTGSLAPAITYSGEPVKIERQHSTAVGHDYTTSEQLGDTEKTTSNVGVPILANRQGLEASGDVKFELTSPPQHSADVNAVVVNNELPKPPELAKPEERPRTGSESIETETFQRKGSDIEGHEQPAGQESLKQPLLEKDSLQKSSSDLGVNETPKKLESMEVEDSLSNHKVAKSLTPKIKSISQRISNFFRSGYAKGNENFSIFSMAHLIKSSNTVNTSITRLSMNKVFKFFASKTLKLGSRLLVPIATIDSIFSSAIGFVKITGRRFGSVLKLGKIELLTNLKQIDSTRKGATLKKIGAVALASIKFSGRILGVALASVVSTDIGKHLTLGLFFFAVGPTPSNNLMGLSNTYFKKIGLFFKKMDKMVDNIVVNDKDIAKAEAKRRIVGKEVDTAKIRSEIAQAGINRKEAYHNPEDIRKNLIELKAEYIDLESQIEDNSSQIEEYNAILGKVDSNISEGVANFYMMEIANLQKVRDELIMEKDKKINETRKYLNGVLHSEYVYMRYSQEEISLTSSFIQKELKDPELLPKEKNELQSKLKSLGTNSQKFSEHQNEFNIVMDDFYVNGSADYLGEIFKEKVNLLRNRLNKSPKEYK